MPPKATEVWKSSSSTGKRVPVYLTEDKHAIIEEEARMTGRSKAGVVAFVLGEYFRNKKGTKN